MEGVSIYTNPHNIICALVGLLNSNEEQINRVIRAYQSNSRLTVFEGTRTVIPADAHPCLEIEPAPVSNSWATTRAQRPRYSFTCTLSVKCDREEMAVEYLNTIATALIEIMTSPENLQMVVPNESRWDAYYGLFSTVILDSLVEDYTPNAEKDGSIRKAEFSWFALIHEPFPDSRFRMGETSNPTVLRPRLVV